MVDLGYAEELEERDEKIQSLLEGNIKTVYSGTQFRALMNLAPNDPESMLQEVALLLYKRFVRAKLLKHADPKPNLISGQLETGKQGQAQQAHIFRLLRHSLSKADRGQFMELRDGEITLSQLVNSIEAQNTGKPP